MSFNSAPHHGHLPRRLANANHRADERREDAGDDHGYSEKCSQAGAAEHAPNNEAHGATMRPNMSPLKACLTGAFSCSDGADAGVAGLWFRKWDRKSTAMKVRLRIFDSGRTWNGPPCG